MLGYMLQYPNGTRIYVNKTTLGEACTTVRDHALGLAERTGAILYREYLENIMLNELEYKEHWVRDDEVPL